MHLKILLGLELSIGLAFVELRVSVRVTVRVRIRVRIKRIFSVRVGVSFRV